MYQILSIIERVFDQFTTLCMQYIVQYIYHWSSICTISVRSRKRKRAPNQSIQKNKHSKNCFRYPGFNKKSQSSMKLRSLHKNWDQKHRNVSIQAPINIDSSNRRIVWPNSSTIYRNTSESRTLSLPSKNFVVRVRRYRPGSLSLSVQISLASPLYAYRQTKRQG